MSFSKVLKTIILAVVYPFWEAEAVETSKARFEPVASNIVSAINANDAEAFSKDFNAPMRELLPPAAARQFLAQIQESVGKVLSRGNPTWPSPDTAVYPLKMERGEANLQITLDSEGRVAGLLLRPAPPAPGEKRFEEVAANLEKAIRERDAKAFACDFNEATRKAITEAAIKQILDGTAEQFGKLLSRGKPSRPQPNVAICPLEFEKGRTDLKIVLDAEGKVAGVWFLPPGSAAPPSKVPERNSVALRLPFRGRWTVFWGGDTSEQNAHHRVPNQRFAFDFLMKDAEGKSARGDATKNEDFFAYGKEIMAPAAAVVTDVIDGVRDNRPGSMNPYSALGNTVILRLAEDQYAILAHLKPGSIRVKPGARVAAGETLGLCGNSGNSSEAHLHFHLQQTPVAQDGIGIKCFFQLVRVEREGKTEALRDYSPVRGDTLLAD